MSSSSSVHRHLRAWLAALVSVALMAAGVVIGAAPANAASAPVDIHYNELNFDYTAGNYTNISGDGKSNGNKVLFKNVITAPDINGNPVTVDALVTTTLSNATVTAYESGTSAGGAATNFQVNLDVNAAYGYGAFTFDFYRAGTYGTAGEDKLTVFNVQMTGYDIDYNQFNVFTGIQGFTWANPTNLSAQNPSTHATLSPLPPVFPADIMFQGPAANNSNIPQDQVVVTYGTLDSVTVRFGAKVVNSPNYFGVAFKALTFSPASTIAYGSTYTLAYDNNGGTGTTPTSQTGSLGQVLTLANPSLTRTGYTLSGWNTAANGTGTHYTLGASYTMPKDGATLYAEWTPITETLTYNANGGTGAPSSQSTTYGNAVTVSSTTPTRSGYTFTGWNTAANGSGTAYAANSSITLTSNVTLYAQWTIISDTLTYDTNGGTGTTPAAQSGSAGQILVLANPTLTKAGHALGGWNTAANGTGTHYALGASFTMPAGGATLYAEWTPITQTLTYDLNGAGGTPPTSQSAGYGSSVPVSSSIPARSGYTFTGWNTAANGGGTSYSSGDSIALTSNVTLYAQWLLTQHTLNYNSNGGTGAPADVTRPEGTTVKVSAVVPTRTGYTFAGWNGANDGLGTVYAAGDDVTLNADVTLYAQWTIQSRTLSYNANGGNGAPGDQTVDFGTSVTVSSAAPTRTGYAFAGWNTVANGSGTAYAATNTFVLNADTVLYAQWTAKGYSLDYDANGGTGAPSGTTSITYGTSVPVTSTTPTRTNYTFTGWNTAANGSGTAVASSGTLVVPPNDVTLYAQWVIDTHGVTYSPNGGTGGPAGQTVDYGDTATVPGTEPTRAGYTFSGWNTEPGGGGTSHAAGDELTVTSDVTLYAQWTAIDYTVAYDANGGAGAPGTQTGHYGDSVTVSNGVPTRAGYTFAGWNSAVNGSGTDHLGGSTLVIATSNVTLYAQWTAIDYTLAYNANGGSGEPDGATVHAGQVVTVSATLPTRSGYTFAGWNTAANGSGTSYAPGSSLTVGAANVMLYARWTANSSGGSGGSGSSGGTDTSGSSGSGGSTSEPVPSTAPETPTQPLPPATTEPEVVRTTTAPGQSTTVNPLDGQTPPAGETWNPSTMQVVDPATGATASAVTTEQGRWTVDPATGAVTYVPKKAFTGTATVAYVLATSAGTMHHGKVQVIVTNKNVRRVTATVYFASGSPVLRKDAKRTLDALVAKVQRRHGKVLYGQSVGFVQNTVFTGNDISLSTARARNVRAHVMGLGVQPIATFEGLGRAGETWKARRATVTITYAIR